MKTLSLLFGLLFACSLNGQTVALQPFSHLEVGGALGVTLIPSDELEATIESTTGDVEDIVIKQVGDKVTIVWKKGKSRSKNRTADISLYYRDLSSISTSAGAMVKSEKAVKVPELAIDCSSGSSAHLNLATEKTKLQASSGASMRLTGSTDHLNSQASSGASINAGRVQSKAVVATSSSGASIKVTATESFEGQASSGSSILYGGSPKSVNYDRKSRSGGSIRATVL